MSKSMLAWHFLPESRRLRDDSHVVEAGYIYSAVGPLEMCINGMHASVKALDALKYAPGPVVCRVKLSGEIISDTDKVCARNREVLWMADASLELRLFGCWCVRNTPLADGRKVWDLLSDPRSRAAVEIAERFARGEATLKELDAAWDAAGDAAWAAARDAAWDAARDAQSARLEEVLLALAPEAA